MKTFISISVVFILLLSACGQGAKTNKTEPKPETTAKTETNVLKVESEKGVTTEEVIKRQEDNPTPEPKAAPHPDAKMPAGSDKSKGGLLNPKEFAQALAAAPDAQLIDVRTPNEVKKGHLPHATNINVFDPKFQENIEKLDKSKPVFLYCAVGGRSGRAVKMIQGLGFKKVFDLRGGITQWKSQGLEVIK